MVCNVVRVILHSHMRSVYSMQSKVDQHTKFLFEAVETDLLHTQLEEGERREARV